MLVVTELKPIPLYQRRYTLQKFQINHKRNVLLEIFQLRPLVLLEFTQDHATEEKENYVLFVCYCDPRIRSADYAVKCYKYHLG